MLLLGDAAHAVTPVGGQGANAALEDCLFLDGILESTGQLTQTLLIPIPGSTVVYNQSINQSISQSINQSINQSISQSTCFMSWGGKWDPTDR